MLFLKEFCINYKILFFQIQQLWHIIFLFIYFQCETKTSLYLILFLQPLLFYVTRLFIQTNFSTWICSSLSLLFITICKRYILFSIYAESSYEYEIHILSVSLSWVNLKCTSYYLENPNCTDFLNMISYCLYLPTIFTGPFILHEDYQKFFGPSKQIQYRVLKFMKNLMYCIIWYTFGNFCLHFVYVNATSFQPQVSMKFYS